MVQKVVVVLVFLNCVVYAHEGEDHTSPEIAAVPAPGSNLIAIGATTEWFEGVLKYPVDAGLNDIPLTLFLSETRTNIPVAGGQVEIQIPDLDMSATASPTDAPGIYRALLSLPRAGSFDVIVSVMAGEQFDLIPMSGLRIGENSDEKISVGWATWQVGLGIVVVIAMGLMWIRIRK